MSTAIILKGISATGKGTRVSTLMEYLKSKYYHESHIIANVPEEDFKNPWQISVFFPEIKTVFIGRWVKSNKSGLMSWSSLDGFSGYQDSLYMDLPTYYKGCNIVMEGYFGGKGSHIWPTNLLPHVDNISYFHFLYDDLEELQTRCVGRSGSRIKGSCWGDNYGYLRKPEYKQKDIDTYIKMYLEAGGKGDMSYTFHRFDESPEVFGRSALKAMGLTDLVLDFHANWSQFSTLRHTDDKEGNLDKYLKYRAFDTENRVLIPMYENKILNKNGHIEFTKSFGSP